MSEESKTNNPRENISINNNNFKMTFYTQTGIIIMFFAIFVFISDFILNIYITNSFPIYRAFNSLVTIVNLKIYMMIFFLILSFSSMIFFYKGKSEFNYLHEKNINWSLLFFAYFLIAFISIYFIGNYLDSFLLDFQYTIYRTLLGITSILSILMNFFLIFVIYLLVRELGGGREKDILYIFATFAMFIVITTLILTNLFLIVGIYNWGTYIFLYSLLEVIGLTVWIFAGYIYLKIWRWNRINRLNIKMETKQFLPRPKSISKYFYTFYSKPRFASIIIIVIALILGGSYSSALGPIWINYTELYKEQNSELLNETSDFLGTEYYSDTLSEYESIDYEINLNFPLTHFSAKLKWIDEADENQRTNQPDMFSCEVIIGELNEKQSSMNEHGQEGRIIIDIEPSEKKIVDIAIITIILESAGDQTGPGGLPFGPLFQEDNSNEFVLEIKYY